VSAEATSRLVEKLIGDTDGGAVVTIIGASGLGKTSLTCCQLPIYLLSKLKAENKLSYKDTCIIVNCDRSLLPKRLTDVCSEFNFPYIDARNYMKFYYPASLSEQHRLILDELTKAAGSEGRSIKYLAVDPLNHHIRMEYSKADVHLRFATAGRLMPYLEVQMDSLLKLTRDQGCLAFVTMLPKRKFADETPAAWYSAYFGPLEVAHLSDVVLYFTSSSRGSSYVNCKVVKNRTREVGQTYTLKLSKMGVQLVE